MICHKAKLSGFGWRTLLYPLIGMGLVLALAMIPTETVESQMSAGITSFFFLSAAGMIAAVALILPGISISYMLLLLGMYDEIMRAISTLYLPFLIPFGLGLVLGILLTAKLLERMMQKYPRSTYLIILGFILGSVVQVFPGFPAGVEIFICLVTLLSGFAAITLIGRLSKNKEG